MNGFELLDPDDEPIPRRRWVKPIAVVVVLAVGLAWSYALWFSLTRDEPEPLDSASRAALVDACTGTALNLNDLPVVTRDDDPEFGAAVVRAENDAFFSMVVALERVQPADPDGQLALRSFLVDWLALIEARTTWADRLARGEETQLVVPVDDRGRPVTVRMNEYAQFHGLAACSPVTLDAELVGGERELTQSLAAARTSS